MVECSPMVQEAWVLIPDRVIPKTQKWYLMPPCLTLSIIWYGSKVKWVNPGKEVSPSLTPWCWGYRKVSLQVTLDYGRQLYFTRPIDGTLSGATTPVLSGPWSDDNEGVLRIPQSSSITEVLASDYLVSYPEHSLGESYLSVERQSVYSTAPANWANNVKEEWNYCNSP